MVLVTYVSEIVEERSLIGLFGQVWAVPFLTYMALRGRHHNR
jgi:hypothetical protein